MVHLCRGEGKTGPDVFFFKIRIIGENLLFRDTGGEKIEHILHPHPQPANAGPSATLFRVEGNALHSKRIRHLQRLWQIGRSMLLEVMDGAMKELCESKYK